MVEILKVKVTQSYMALWQEYWSGLPYPLGIILTQGSNPGLHWRQSLYHLSHEGSQGGSQISESLIKTFQGLASRISDVVLG